MTTPLVAGAPVVMAPLVAGFPVVTTLVVAGFPVVATPLVEGSLVVVLASLRCLLRSSVNDGLGGTSMATLSTGGAESSGVELVSSLVGLSGLSLIMSSSSMSTEIAS